MLLLYSFPWPSVTKRHTCGLHGANLHTSVSFMLEVLVPEGWVFFSLSCFLHHQLSQLRGRDRNFTLLHALVEQILLHEPHLATFTQELAEFETVPGGKLAHQDLKKTQWFFPFEMCLNETCLSLLAASIKGLTAEVDGE